MTVLWLALSLLVGCGGETPAEGAAGTECDLTLDTLEGKTFLMSEAQPDKSYKDNPMARVKFQKGENGMEALYTAMSVSDVYTYPCNEAEGEGDEREIYCAEEERVVDWCQSLEVNEAGSCNRKALRKLGVTHATDEEIKVAIKKARATVKEYRDGDKWAHFKMNNNNLGNKLQGRMYLKVDEKRCRLSVSDMYFTVYNGEAVEDTNPVGINPFVENDQEWMFEHCEEGRGVMADLNEADPPADPATITAQQHETGKPVYYYYFGEKDAKAEEGCTYTADTWTNWKKVGTDLPITPEESGQLLWRGSHTWEQDALVSVQGKNAAIFEMVRYKQCAGGERTKINTSCNVFVL